MRMLYEKRGPIANRSQQFSLFSVFSHSPSSSNSKMAAISRVTTAIVTGGASGLGRATALRLARRGMGVVVADIKNETPFDHDNIRYAETDVS